MNRLAPFLENEQPADQFGFRRGLGIDDAMVILENVCGKCLAWESEIWFASLDLEKAFERTKHHSSSTVSIKSSRHEPARVTPVIHESIWKCWRQPFGFNITRGVARGCFKPSSHSCFFSQAQCHSETLRATQQQKTHSDRLEQSSSAKFVSIIHDPVLPGVFYECGE